MTYDHSRKAGNLGDVWKHAVLVSIAEHLPAGPTFRYVETHAGAPIHRLGTSGEWCRGVGALIDQVGDSSHRYLRQARSYVARNVYPAGWLFFADIMAQRVESLAITLHDTSAHVAQHYQNPIREPMPSNMKSIFRKKNGYSAIDGIEADLIFLDPPFAPEDWGLLARACRELKNRGITFVAWYPIYWPTKPSQLIRETSQCGWEVMWRDYGPKPCQNMKGCGMLISDDLVAVLEAARSDLENVARLAGADKGILIHNFKRGD